LISLANGMFCQLDGVGPDCELRLSYWIVG
jgi:hypothetical protein